MAEGLGEISPDVILSALQILVTPSDRAPKPGDARQGESTYFQHVLQASLEGLHQRLTTDRKFHRLQACLSNISCCACGADPQWSFVLHCLHLLSLLRKSLASALEQFKRKEVEEKTCGPRNPNQAPPLSPDTLSLQQQGTITKVLQFLVCLGVVPSLQPGVGLPLASRSEFASKLVGAENMSSQTQVSRLLVCGQVLLDCLDVGSLCCLVLSRHLTDVLALLLQLCHGTKWETVTVQEVSGLYPRGGNRDSSFEGSNSTEGSLASLNGSGAHVQLPNDDGLDTKAQTGVTDGPLLPGSASDNQVESGSLQHSETQPASGSMTPCNSVDSATLPPAVPASSSQAASRPNFHHKELCFRWLRKVLRRVPPQLLVRELLVLQGRPQKGVPPKGRGAPPGGVQGTPPWLRRVCGRLLCDILTDSKGVLHVLAGMMQGPHGQFTGDWQSCNAVAKVIVVGARTVTDKESYYRRVCPQILSLLRQPSKAGDGHFARVVSASLRESLAFDSDLAQRHLVQPLLAPLLRCCHGNAAVYKPGQVLVQEDELTVCIEDLHKVLVLAAEPDSTSLLCLHPILPALFQVYSTAHSGVSHLRTPSRELLTAYLKEEETTLALACLQFLLFKLDPENRFKPVPSCLLFQPGPQGGVIVTVRSAEGADSEDVPFFLTEEDCQGAMALLSGLQACGLAGEFFIFLMKELTKIIKAEAGSEPEEDAQSSCAETGDTECHGEKTLLEIERRQQAVVTSFQGRLSLLSVLAAMCETLGPDCLKSTLHILEFVQATLQRGVEVCEKAEEELTGLFESETLTMAMGLLTAVMAEGKKLGEAECQKMDELLPLLEQIGINHSDPTVQEMASDLRIAIATRGVVWSKLMKDKVAKAEKAQSKRAQKSQAKPATPVSKKPSKPLIEVLSETVTEEPDADSSSRKSPEDVCTHNTLLSTESKPRDQNVAAGKTPSTELRTSGLGDFVIPVSGKGDERSALKQAYEELCDPLIPVRGHALLTLTHLLEEGNAEALAEMDTLLKIFMENVAHGDSYLYLASVGGLAALAGRRHQTVVPRLAAEFADWHAAGKLPKSADLRAKLGEVLLKATRNLGDMAPMYRDILLRSLLCGTRDTDAMVRASSLSNLAELCRLLRFALGPVLHEVLECCSSLLRADREVEVRKAAALMLTQLLEGLGKDVFKVLESVLRDFYRLLKLQLTVEKDEGVRLHLALALEQLDDVMREFLFAKPILEKKIRLISAD